MNIRKLLFLLLLPIFSYAQPVLDYHMTDSANVALFGRTPQFMYYGSSFYTSRVNQILNGPFTSRTTGTNVPIHLFLGGDSRWAYGTLSVYDAIGQYGSINSIGFVSPFSNIFGSACTFSYTGTAGTNYILTRNDNTSYSTWGIAGARLDMVSASSWTVQPATRFPSDKIRIFYNITVGGGSFSYAIDGGAPVTVNTTQASGIDQLGTVTISSGLANQGTHSVVITWVSGNARIYGMEFENQAQSGFVPDIIQSGGSQAAQWDGSLKYTTAYVAATNPAVGVVWLDVNDAVSARTVAQFSTNISNIISQLAFPAQCATVLMGHTWTQTANGSGIQNTTVDDLQDGYTFYEISLVKSTGISFFNLRQYIPPFSYWVSQGLFSDFEHPTIAFAPYFWQGLAAALFPNFQNPMLTQNFQNFLKQSQLIPSNSSVGFGLTNESSLGVQTELNTGWYAKVSNGTNVMYYQSAGTEQLRLSSDGTTNTQLITAYPTSTFSTVLQAQRQGTPATNAFKLGVDGSGNTTLSTNNGAVNVTATTLAVTGKISATNTISASSAISANAWGLTGIAYNTPTGTYTDANGSGTVTNMAVNSFGVPTISTTNTGVTYTNGYNVYIAGVPVSGTNTPTFTNAYSLGVSGNANFLNNVFGTSFVGTGGNAFISSSTFPTSSFASRGTDGAAQTTAGVEIGGVQTYSRALFNGGSAMTPAANNAATNVIVGNTGGITLPATGTTPELSQFHIKTLGTITNASSIPITLAANLVVEAAPTGATTNASIVSAGNIIPQTNGGANLGDGTHFFGTGDISNINTTYINNVNNGSETLDGTTSGVITLQTQAAAGTYNWNWPTSAGSLNQVLTSQAGGSAAQTYSTVPMVLATVAGISTKSTGATNLYVVPSGKTLTVTAVYIRCTAASAITVAASADIGDSTNGAASIYTNSSLSGLTTSGKIYQYSVGGGYFSVAAGSTVKLNINTASTGTSQTVQCVLVGFLE